MEITPKRHRKSCLDIAETLSKILGAVAVPIIIATIGYFIQRDVANISSQTDWQKHDLSIVQEFNKTYFQDNGSRNSESKRKLAFSYIFLLKDDDANFRLREFIMWDILFSIVKDEKYKGQQYKYDTDNIMWGTFAWNLSKMYKLPKRTKLHKACIDKVINEYAPLQLGEYASKEEIFKIFHPPAFDSLLKDTYK